jgi:hypothetical protein
MNIGHCKRVVWSTFILAAGGLIAGCGNNATVDSFIPEDITAKEALEKALTAWQNGQEKPGSLPGGKTEIRVADERWSHGAKLKNFEIGEPLEEDGPARFPVKLTLEGAAAPEEEIYIVVGKNPLWVWTKAEYERSAGM